MINAPISSQYSDGSKSMRAHAATLSSVESTSSFAFDVPVTPPAVYYSTRQIQADQLAQFFGASQKSRTDAVALPSYSAHGDIKLPTYEEKPKEPTTLARFMFIYGFVFPPFWLVGLIILTSELHPTAEWAVGKTEEEKIRLMQEMRMTEVKWAKRCVYALITLITVIFAIVVAAVFAKRRSSA